MKWSSKANSARLEHLAASQGGYFTTRDARQAGYVDAVHSYHVKEGHWEKILRGIYRLSDAPATAMGPLHIALLWSRNRSGAPEGVISHESAAFILGIMYSTPAAVHLSVPKDFRRNSETPDFIHLHKVDWSPGDTVDRDGLLCTSPQRTAQDLNLPPPRRPTPYDAIINAGED